MPDTIHEAPDYVQPIIGWRVWRLPNAPYTTAAPRLQSVIIDDIWPPRKPFVAGCNGTLLHFMNTSEYVMKLGLGIHARKTKASTIEYAHRMRQSLPKSARGSIVIGTVKLWGHVVEHSDGYRAEFAYPERIIVFDPAIDRERLSEIYGVPVEYYGSILPNLSLLALCSASWGITYAALYMWGRLIFKIGFWWFSRH